MAQIERGDPDTATQANLDGIDGISLAVARYYKSLIRSGLPREVASVLTERFQQQFTRIVLGMER